MLLSEPCHQLKDRSTPDRLYLAKRQAKGKEVTLDDYKRVRDKWERNILILVKASDDEVV
jgi:hypothetical protein